MKKQTFQTSKMTKKELEIRLWKADRFNKLRESYLSYVLQNIRTQMNNITGFSKLMTEEGHDPEKRASFYEQIEKSTEKLDRLVSESLNMAVMSLDDINVQAEPCFVNYLMDDIYSYFSQQKKVYSKAYVELYLHQDTEKEDFAIHADCSRLRQILAQLIGNSLANCTDGDEIEFGYKLLDEGKSGILFYVEDNGTLYSKEEIDAFLKEPELYLKSSTDDLKLESVDFMVLQTLVEMMDGEMSIITNRDKGIRFEIVLPYNKPEQRQEKDMHDDSVEEVESLQNAFDWKDKKILIAEDVESNYLLIEEALQSTKATVLHAENGKEAVEIFEQNPDIDLILMDIKMPVMDGLDATREIKAKNPDVPIIAQTAFVIDNDKQSAMDAGCDNYVSKPLNFEKLFKNMDLYMNNMV